MASSYQAAGWVGFAAFIVASGGAIFLRRSAKHQITRLKLVLLLAAYAAQFPSYGFEAVTDSGGTTVIAGSIVNWLRYVSNAISLTFFGAFVGLSLDPIVGKSFVVALLALGTTLPLVFASLSANDGVWFWWIFAVLGFLVMAPFVAFFLLVPPELLKMVSNSKHWFTKLLVAFGYAVYVFVGYLIDTPWTDATNDISLLQWLNVGWNIIFLIGAGLYIIGWVDLYENPYMINMQGGGGLPYLQPVQPSVSSNAASPLIPNAAPSGLRMP